MNIYALFWCQAALFIYVPPVMCRLSNEMLIHKDNGHIRKKPPMNRASSEVNVLQHGDDDPCDVCKIFSNRFIVLRNK